MITTTDHRIAPDQVDVAVIDLVDCGKPVARREQVAPVARSAIAIPPSDQPAFELPDYEPTAADLLVIESFGDIAIDARIASANTLAAFEARHRELLRLRAELSVVLADELDGLDDLDLERVA